MLEKIKEKLPEFAKDARVNLTKVLDSEQPEGLSSEQILGCALTVAFHLADDFLIQELSDTASSELIAGAKLAASLMAMTNIYYRFIHLAEMPELNHIPAGLRMQSMMNPGIDKNTFEMMSLAVSILNGCGACINAHCQQLKEHGVTAQSLARIGRIAAVMHMVHVSLKL